MIKYCTYCQKEYDFKVKSMKELDHLTCPVCGNSVDKDSKKPAESVVLPEEAIGNGLQSLYLFLYYLKWGCVLTGFLSYFMHWNIPFIGATILGAVVMLLQFGIFGLGGILILIGFCLGFLVQGSIRGAGLGVLIMQLCYLIFRNLLGSLIGSLIRGSRSAK